MSSANSPKPGVVAQAKRAALAKFELHAKTILANVQAAIDEQRGELLKEIDERILLQAQLPGIDISAYDVIQRFSVEHQSDRPLAAMVKVGEIGIGPVPLEPHAKYTGFFLMRKLPEEGVKK